MNKLTPAQKAANTRQRNKFMAALKAKQALFRSDSKLLAKEIADNIRADEHANEHVNHYENGSMHWYQAEWGQVRLDRSLLQQKGRVVEVTCPTTGCVAGWATTLAGYPMALRHTNVAEIMDAFQGERHLKLSECNYEGEVRSIMEVGQELLNLSSHQSRFLFDGSNSKEQVLWCLDQIAENGYFDVDMCPFDNEGNRCRDEDGNWLDESEYEAANSG